MGNGHLASRGPHQNSGSWVWAKNIHYIPFVAGKLSLHTGNMAGNRVLWCALLLNAPSWENALP